MAHVTKTITVPAKTQTVTDHWKCELCDNTTENERNWGLSTGDHNIDSTKVEVEEGDSYPEVGYSKRIILDICSQCFREKLIPWFQSQGGSVREEETDW